MNILDKSISLNIPRPGRIKNTVETYPCIEHSGKDWIGSNTSILSNWWNILSSITKFKKL